MADEAHSGRPVITFKVEEPFLEKVEDFRYANRFPTRTEAMKYLMAWALENGATASPEDRRRLLRTA